MYIMIVVLLVALNMALYARVPRCDAWAAEVGMDARNMQQGGPQ